MADELREEFLRSKVRDALRSCSVKLWLAPFVSEDGETNREEIEKVAHEYSSKLSISEPECVNIMLDLQENAKSRIKEQEQFRAGGLATLRIRLNQPQHQNIIAGPSTSQGPNAVRSSANQIRVEIPLCAVGSDLERAVLEKCGSPGMNLKLICNGQVLKKHLTLSQQGVNNFAMIMAVVLTDAGNEVEMELSRHSVVDKTRHAVATLSKSSTRQLELENQQGESLNLPKEEKDALVLAMTFHERGRSALKQSDYSLALVLLLEADQEYKRCNSDLLKSVDNYALLNLDIVWCYLCLRSVTHVPDAEKRLRECEASFEKSYGKHLERVILLKGATGNEAVLLLRLHLLQAIVMFHQNKIEAARRLLSDVENELKGLKVSDSDIQEVASLGYTTSEARLGLRACRGNCQEAVTYIDNLRTERIDARKRHMKEVKLNKRRQKLGLTADGSQYIEPDNVKQLEKMGFDRELVISALKHSNNNMTQAVFLIQEQPHLLSVKKRKICSNAITQVAAMGFDVDIARCALKKHNGNIEQALNDLISNNGFIEYSEENMSIDDAPEETPAPEDPDHVAYFEAELEEEEEEEDVEETQRQYDELAKDLPFEEDDHLNISLEDEEQFLSEYKALLE